MRGVLGFLLIMALIGGYIAFDADHRRNCEAAGGTWFSQQMRCLAIRTINP